MTADENSPTPSPGASASSGDGGSSTSAAIALDATYWKGFEDGGVAALDDVMRDWRQAEERAALYAEARSLHGDRLFYIGVVGALVFGFLIGYGLR